MPVRPRVIQKVAPEYSAEARAAGLEGVVSLYAEIDEAGVPVRVTVLQGLGMGLDDLAKAAVAQWRFAPAAAGAEPARIGMDIELPFQSGSGGGWQVSRSIFRFDPADRKPDPGTFESPLLAKPVQTQYTRPDPAACVDSGAWEVGFTIAPDGTTTQAHVLRGIGGPAADAAMRAVETWRYLPASRNGRPVAVKGEIQLACASGQASSEPAVPVFRVGGGVTAPRLQFKIEPEYSEEARRAKYQGTVTLSLDVGEDGYAHNIYTLRMLGLGLDEKAVEAVRQWHFQPGTKDGMPVRVHATIEVNFRLL
jgi:TonB family protein